MPGVASRVTVRQMVGLFKRALGAWNDDDASSMGAAIAYYTLFSVAPLLVLVIAISGLIFGREAAQGQILTQLRGLVGDAGATAVQDMLRSASTPARSIAAAIASAITLLLGATSVFTELYGDLNKIWRMPAAPKASGIVTLLRTRLLSFGMILGIGFLLLVSLVMSAALAALGTWWGDRFPAWGTLVEIINAVLSLGLITASFAMIYKFLPRARIAWKDVWAGALCTAVLFELGKLLIGIYLGKTKVATGFGAAGSLAVFLVWVYYSAQIFLLGAEFTWVYAYRHGSRSGEAPPEPPPPRRGRPVSAAEAEKASKAGPGRHRLTRQRTTPRR
jgi:membrane protein